MITSKIIRGVGALAINSPKTTPLRSTSTEIFNSKTFTPPNKSNKIAFTVGAVTILATGIAIGSSFSKPVSETPGIVKTSQRIVGLGLQNLGDKLIKSPDSSPPPLLIPPLRPQPLQKPPPHL